MQAKTWPLIYDPQIRPFAVVMGSLSTIYVALFLYLSEFETPIFFSPLVLALTSLVLHPPEWRKIAPVLTRSFLVFLAVLILDIIFCLLFSPTLLFFQISIVMSPFFFILLRDYIVRKSPLRIDKETRSVWIPHPYLFKQIQIPFTQIKKFRVLSSKRRAHLPNAALQNPLVYNGLKRLERRKTLLTLGDRPNLVIQLRSPLQISGLLERKITVLGIGLNRPETVEKTLKTWI